MERGAGPSTPRTLFPTGPNFTLDDFSNNDFIVRDFVDDLADNAVPASRRNIASSGQAAALFDPKPLIRTFENALSQLATLAEDLGSKESELMSQVRQAEAQHDQTLDTLGRKLDQSMASFEALDLSLNNSGGGKDDQQQQQQQQQQLGGGGGPGGGGGNVAVQIGEKLEDLDRKRRRAQDASFLIQCWTEVSETGELTSLQDVQRQGGPENKVRCAVMARQLMRISQRLDPASWGEPARHNGVTNGVTAAARRHHNTREVVEKFCEALEQDLLLQFNNSYRRQNFDDMLECSRVLHDFNGGASVIAAFVNQHQFFIDRDNLVAGPGGGGGLDDSTAAAAAAEHDGTWDRLADPDSEPPGVDPGLQSLVDEVRIVMQEESFVIRRAFPYYETVLAKFIQRVFQQSVQQRLEQVLDKAATISSLAFLRSLHSARMYVGALVEDLKAHGLTEHPEPCSAQISQILDQQLEELFVPYLVSGPSSSSYMDRERRSLEEMYGSVLLKYTIYHSRRKKAPTGFMASLAQQGTQLLASAKDAYLDRLESSELAPTQKAMMLRVAGLHEGAGGAGQAGQAGARNEIEVSEQDGALSVENARRMLAWLAESVRRALELGAPAEMAKDVAVLLNLVLSSLGQVYVETALDAAQDLATAQENSKVEPDLGYLPAVRPAVAITGMMDKFISTVLIRLAETNATARRGMEAQKRAAIDTIERKANAVIKATVDVVSNWVARSLGGQRKTDFRPREDDRLEYFQTPTCLAICTFLSRAATLAAQAVDGPNLIRLSSEVAAAVLALLLDHFKKFQVNATGGLSVTQDIAKYASTLRGWTLAGDVEASVELLAEIGSLFIVGPEALREKARVLTGVGAGAGAGAGAAGAGAGRRLAKTDFRAFVQKREDSGSVGIQSVLASL